MKILKLELYNMRKRISRKKRVLALKYRPHRFEDLVGQSTVSQTHL